MDQLPLDGRLTDLGGFARLGAEGVDLLMSDSTNAEVPGFVTSERDIAPVLDEMFAETKQRIIVACFASHVHRVQQVLDAAAGARPQGRLRRPLHGAQHGRRPRPRLPARCRRSAAGCWSTRATPRACRPVRSSWSAPGRRASRCRRCRGWPARDHPIRIAEGDTVILASSLIPGNETAVYRVINELTRLGRPGGAQGQRAGARLRATRPPVSCCTCSTWSSRATSCRCTASGGTCGRTPTWPRSPGSPSDNIVIAEDGVVVDLVGRPGHGGGQGAVRLRLRGRPVRRRGDRDLAQGPPDPGRGGVHVRRDRGRLDHRQAGGRAGDPRPRVRHRRLRAQRGPAEDRGGADPRGRGRDQRRPSAGPAGPAHRRALGQRRLPPPPHDHSGGHRV